MKNKLSCSPLRQRPASNLQRLSLFAALLCATTLCVAAEATAGDAPSWMHALVNAPLPTHDEKTDAVLLYSENIVTVQSADKIKTLVRAAYKILRPGGRDLGTIVIHFDSMTKINHLHAWSIPAQGKDYEVKDKEAAEVALPAVPGSELINDVRAKVLNIPAADPGNIIGWEYEQQDHPFVLQDVWYVQGSNPIRETHYSLQLPPGWEYKAFWVNHEDVAPTPSGNNQWQWVVSGVPALKHENEMPPRRGLAGHMIVSFMPSGGAQSKTFLRWQDMGLWYADLTRDRRDASPDIKQKVAALTSSTPTTLAKMQALSRFLQREVRYVAIELGIGGFQPHPASDVYAHRYGDCKDKVTLLSAMLKELGIESYYVVIHTERGAVTTEMPPFFGGFNHMILAVRLPDGLEDSSLKAVIQHPKLGRLLFYDPTDELTPFGYLRGSLQANYGLLVTSEGGELTKLPELPTALNGILRTGKLTLTPEGILTGDVKEVRIGDRAAQQRAALKSVMKNEDRIKPIENMLAYSLSAYHLTKATVTNLEQTDQPFEYNYSLVAEKYAKPAGGLLLVRPRVLGAKSSDLLETKEARQYPVVFDGPSRDVDTFDITIPQGFQVDDLPPPVDADYGFASYHSKAEVNGKVLRYTRTFEVKELTVPLAKVPDLKKLYRIIASDERNTAVLKPVPN